MGSLYDKYVDMMCAYIDSRDVYKAVRKTSANGTVVSDAKTLMEFNKSQMQLALDKYLLSVVKGGVV